MTYLVNLILKYGRTYPELYSVLFLLLGLIFLFMFDQLSYLKVLVQIYKIINYM
jgi:hypothetical protein